MKTIAIIPARGGSKGIPKKNIIDFCGKPLLAWSIIQAVYTPEIDDVYVSSDSDEILAIAENYGAKRIKRPEAIAGDTAASESAVEHALKNIGTPVGTIIMLQATSPLRKPDDLRKALMEFELKGLDSLFSGALLEDFLIWDKDSAGKLKSFNYDYLNRGRRQDRRPQYLENGSFYIFKPGVFAQGNRLGGKIGVYIMELWQSYEIDTVEDLEFLKMIFDYKLKSLY